LRAIFVLDLFYLLGDLTGQHVLKLKATLITILQGSLCGLFELFSVLT